MKKLAFILFLAGAALPGLSQKLEKYEEVLPRILALPPSGALAQLKIYLAEQPDNSSIYLQMAVIYEKRYRESDPIKDFAYKVGNAREALKAYQRTEQFISEKEVRKNQEYFFNFGTLDDKGRVTVGFDTISNHMARVKVELQSFIDNVPLIYDKFTRSFSSYDRAHKAFTGILGKYPTFKDLYLLYDAEVDKTFGDIKKDYLECLQYWKEYKAATASFDVGYSQTMTAKPIKVYRLDGLESKINFLQPKIQVWDYASWVDTTREIIHAEIDKLREDLMAENLRLNKRIEEAKPDFIREEFEPLKVSKEVLFTLRKYDLSSVIEPIFIFKEKKHDLIYQQLLSEKLGADTEVDVERKLYLYGQMVNRIKEADSVLSDIRRTNTAASLSKYSDFIKTNYNGPSGITQLITTERQNNKNDVSNYVANIQNELYAILKTDSVIKKVKYKKLDIPLFRSVPVDNDLLTAAPITSHRIENFDGSAFIAGIFKNTKENKTQAFVAGITKEQTVGWYNDYLLKIDSSAGFDANTRIGAIQSVPGGLAVILNGVDTSGTRINHLLMLDEKGVITHSRRLILSQFPRTISYNERTNTLFVTYKGNDYLDDPLVESEMIMANYSIYGDLQWQQRMSYKGDITDVVSVDQAYIIVGNYNEIKGLDGRVNRAGKNNTDTKAFAVKINLAGELLDLKTIDYSSSYFANKTYKVSDDCINFFGSMGAYTKTVMLDSRPESAVHVIMNKDLEILASTLK